MMGRLEDVHFAVPTVERRYAEARLGLAQCPVTQSLEQYASECLPVVEVAETPEDLPANTLKTPDGTPSRRRKDLASSLDVDVAQCRCGMSRRQTERQDAASRSARNDVEVLGHRTAAKEAILEAGEEGGREDPTDAPAVNGKNAKWPIRWPRKRVASLLQGAIGPLRWSTCLRFHWPSLRGRMPPSTGPLTGGEPTLVARQPVDRPGHNRLGDRHGGAPFACSRIVQAEEWTFRASAVRIMMGNRIVGRLVPPMHERIGHCDTRPTFIDHPSPWISSVRHADRVGLAEWPQGPDPHDEVTFALHHSEFRPIPPHGVRLVPGGQFPHLTRSSP